MCGILGSIPCTNETDFLKALNTLQHRGPDDFGILSDTNITLGHRRLSIIDLRSNAHQPMSFKNSAGGGGSIVLSLMAKFITILKYDRN